MAATAADAAQRRHLAELPATVALPDERPEAGKHPPTAPEAGLPEENAPLPQSRPDTGSGQHSAPESPAPEAKGSAHPDIPTNPARSSPDEQNKPTYEADSRSSQRAASSPPAEEIACRTRLAELGVVFEIRPEERDPVGCSLPYPLWVSKLGKVELQPPALMNCAIAETSARFAHDVVQPAAQARFGEDLSAIAQASTYVCRPRNGTRKLSEHAFGNALDIAAFVLSRGTRVEVEAGTQEKEMLFLSDVRKAACGPFKTVLGPGSNADHATHFHLDLAPRRNGGTYCR